MTYIIKSSVDLTFEDSSGIVETFNNKSKSFQVIKVTKNLKTYKYGDKTGKIIVVDKINLKI